MDKTKIRWTDTSWNPVTGCTQVSPGCDNCYALRIAEQKRGTKAFPVGFDVQLRPHKVRDPLKWRKPRMVFVNSMSDLFHRDIPDHYIREIWDTMVRADHHIYQVLTKRAHRMAHKIRELNLQTPAHIWLGVSAENQAMAESRIPPLLDFPGDSLRWVSAEPLLDAVDLSPYLRADGQRLEWVVLGGESGPGRRHMEYDWARAVRDQCAAAGVPFFYKQGNAYRSDGDKVLDGRQYDEYPEAAWRASGPQAVAMQGVFI